MRSAPQYVRETVDLVKQIETRFLELGERLYVIREEELWRERHDSYSEFLEAIGIQPSLASRLYAIHLSYVVEGKLSAESLAGVGYSKLYEAIPLIEGGGVKIAVAKARSLARDEILDEVRDERHGEHRHVVGEARWGSCEKCGKLVRVDGKAK